MHLNGLFVNETEFFRILLRKSDQGPYIHLQVLIIFFFAVMTARGAYQFDLDQPSLRGLAPTPGNASILSSLSC
jgi:hypothetical protein